MIIALLQARVSSSRLPGKVLMPILGRPMLALQLERLLRCKAFDRLVVATSDRGEDDRLASLCEEMEVEVFRGSLGDVLDRFYQAAVPHAPEHIVRLTGDCPLADPQLIDRIVAHHLKSGADYTTNAMEPTFPDGLDVEVVRFCCLEEAWRVAELPSEREHVTPYVNRRPERFHIEHFKEVPNRSHLRWTVDEAADFEFVRQVYKTLYPVNPSFTTDDILTLLDTRPRLAEINSGVQRNEGAVKSFEADARYLAGKQVKKGA